MIKLVARLLGLVLLTSAVARAEVVQDLYVAEVPIAEQSAAALAVASGEALADVLVKVSGSIAVLQNPAVVAALGQARSHVQQYAYSREEGAEDTLLARFEFDHAYVARLVREAGLPFWTANRPEVLVWLVAEDAGGRYFVNGDSAPELTAQLLAAFSRRGVPVQVPLYDLADSTMITPEDVWQLNGSALRAASGRYHVQDVIGGRLATLSDGSIAGDWAYLHGDDRIDRSVSASERGEFLRGGAGIVAEGMAARYAVASSVLDTGSVGISVAGVNSYADYAAVVAWLESLELIDSADVAWVRGDMIELRLQAQGDAGQLARIIELNKRLLPEPANAAASQLNYRWQN